MATASWWRVDALGGTLVPAGSKNEALPVLAASLLAPGSHRIANLPLIRDVGTLLEILAGLSVRAALPVGGSEVRLDTQDVNGRTPSADLGGTIRGSFLLAPGLLHRTGRAVLPRPGGDRIGRRRVDTHLHALRMLGAEIEPRERHYHLRLDGRFRGTDIFFDEASVMATEIFILMGELLLRSGIADGMYRGLSLWLTGLPGGLLHSNIACCALFAATTGSSVACVATIGTVALPELDKRGYDKPMALGSLAAGGTLGILIPPSVALLVYGSLTNNSISKLFVGGVIPGIALTLCFSAFIFTEALRRPTSPEERRATWRERIAASPLLLPPLIVFTVVMGSIYFGLATPTEAAALGIAVALLFAWPAGKLSLKMLHPCFIRTAQLTGMILLIITGAFVLNLALSMLGVAQAMTKVVVDMNLSLNKLILALIVFYLILGCFLDVLAMQVATIPIVYPIVTAVGGDPIWLGIFIVLMSEIGMITPPVGMNLFVIQGVRRDGGPLRDVIKGAWPYVIIMLLFTLLLIQFPALVTWLPRQM